MNPQTVIVSLSPEAAQLLADNSIDLLSELNKQGLEVSRGSRPKDLRQNPSTKSIELIILASAVATPLVASAIARVIDAVGRNRKAVVTDHPVAAGSSPLAQREAEHGVKFSFLGLEVNLTDKFNTKT
jgi:hypothetical protein